MTLRRLAVVFVVAVLAAPGTASAANYSTANFTVKAPTPELAQKFGDMAEHYRREKAIEWLGREMPQWPQRCPLDVQVVMGSAGGATTFTFGSNGTCSVVTSQQMEIRGDVKQLLNSVLPHEITHTVLAQHFGRPVPRWADEGGSVLSENDEERFSHDVRCRELLNIGRGIRLRVLFKMTEYPRDMIVLYAQGYSITSFLVERGGSGRDGRAKLLEFLGTGMAGNTPESWNEAARRVYGFESVDQVEEAWLTALRAPFSRTAARNNGSVPSTPTSGRGPSTEYATTPAARSDVRTSAAPALPVLEPPVAVRGATPGDDETNRGPRTLTPARPTAPDRPQPLLLPPEIPRN